MKVSVGTIARTVAVGVTLTNSVLTLLGKNPLPWSENEVYTAVTTVATVAATAWAWWKNNSFTKEAIEADQYMQELKKGEECDFS